MIRVATPRLRPPAPGTIRLSPAVVIPDLLREFGADPQPLFEKVGLSIHSLSDPDKVIAYDTMSKLVIACVEETACHHFGLLIGQRNDIGTLGLIGFLAQNDADAGTALRDLIRYFNLHDRGATIDVTVSEGSAAMSYNLVRPNAKGSGLASDVALAVMSNVMFALCGPKWKPLRVDFSHAEPKDLEPYESCFQAPLVFSAKRNALVFDSKWLEARIERANPKLRRHLQKSADEMSGPGQLGFKEEVFQRILARVRSGPYSATEISGEFAMHRRTLHRHLKLSQTSFREMQNQARHQIACELLRDTSSHVDAIAGELGYTSSSAFIRAFSKREGMPPMTWRKQAVSPALGR